MSLKERVVLFVWRNFFLVVFTSAAVRRDWAIFESASRKMFEPKFLGKFWQKLGYFLFQHLVTLLYTLLIYFLMFGQITELKISNFQI